MKKGKKILMAATSGKDFSGGASKSFLTLCLELKKLGFEIIVWVPDRGKLSKRCLNAGLECVCGYEFGEWVIPIKFTIKEKIKLKIKKVLNIVTYKSQKEFIRKLSPDFIHINAITKNYRLATIANELNIPVVWHIREFLEEDLDKKFSNENAQISVLNKAHGFIGISNEIKNTWKSRVKPRICTVYNGVNTADYCVKSKTISSKKCNIILYGRIAEGKNQLFFLRGVNKFLAKRLNINTHFYLAGSINDQAYFEKCKKYIKDHNLQRYVSCLGEITDVKKLLQNQNIVCVCSKREAFGRVNVEALMGRCLVVASDSGANKEIIKDGENGYIYKHDDLDAFVDKLIEAIKNKDNFDYNEIQRNAVKKFSAEENAKNVVRVYKKLGLVD